MIELDGMLFARSVDPPADAPHRGTYAAARAVGLTRGALEDALAYATALTTTFEGTSEVQRRIIADRLLDDGLLR